MSENNMDNKNNENLQNSTPNNNEPLNGGENNNFQGRWDMPAHNGQEYQPPYGDKDYQASQQPPQEELHSLHPQQYSTQTGWQAGSGASSNKNFEKDSYRWNFSDYEAAQTVKPKKRRKGVVVFAVVMSCILVFGLASIVGVATYHMVAKNNAPVDDTPSVQVPASDLPSIELQDKPQTEETPSVDGKLTTEQIVEKVEPSVVGIVTYMNYQNYQASGQGSGIIMREDGYIVTNAHVVADAAGIKVILSNGEEYEARAVGIDNKVDVAVIKIEAEGLTAAEFGNSDQVKVGEKVIAIGTPRSMDFAGTVTQGIISGLNRTITADSQYTYSNLLQTDAAINPGNSGGALVNEYGQVIGINSAKIVTQTYEGIGFAIPSNEIKPIVDDLIQYGHVTGRVKLGIVASPVDEVLARMNGWPTGLLVQSTEEGSDISQKGVVPGDIITKAQDQDLDGFQSLKDVIDDMNPGDTVDLEVYRPSATTGGKGRFFNVSVALMEDTSSGTPSQQPSENYSQQPETQDPSQIPGGFDSYEDFFNYFFQ
ncbi:S1C family serine protease [Youxingia wuxianensis]|uniref:Trypsin-like peptidase domain-containing protein n=1 Tax=Youxingia wuxianensis TaxID=2763678 RepID=A0A926EQA2_9FIRM|nr:trypsin-like peptidase domain-containing protein [Youxingia wuxianensis]MBC8584569.1 trypsin-like peptidase domain-containing protein [Youxingia wuxianensis]